MASYICYVRKSNNLFIRNFELHQVVKRISLNCTIRQMEMAPGTAPYVMLLTSNNSLLMIDFVNEDNQTEKVTVHDRACLMKMCPNGRYVLTGGDKGDLLVYKIKRITNTRTA